MKTPDLNLKKAVLFLLEKEYKKELIDGNIHSTMDFDVWLENKDLIHWRVRATDLIPEQDDELSQAIRERLKKIDKMLIKSTKKLKNQ